MMVQTTMMRQLKELGERVGAPGITFHAFRHFHASVCLEDDENAFATSRRLGHGSITTTIDEYGHLLKGRRKSIASAFARAMEPPPDLPPPLTLRTNQHVTLKTNPLTRAHLDDFVSCYRADDRTQREESERFRRFTYDELTRRDKVNLDIFWLRDESLEDSENLTPPDVIAEEIMEDLRAALEQLGEIAADLGGGG